MLTPSRRAVCDSDQGPHHPVHLRMPGVCCDQNPHQTALGRDGGATALANRINDNIAISYFSHMTVPGTGRGNSGKFCDGSIYGL